MPPRSAAEVDVWIRNHEAEHRRSRSEAALERDAVIAAVKEHVERIEAKTDDQTRKLETLDTLKELAEAAAEERGRRKERDEDLARRKVEAEVALKRWQRWALPLGIAAPVIAALLTYLVTHAAH